MKRIIVILLVLFAIVTALNHSGKWSTQLGEDGRLYILSAQQTQAKAPHK